MAWTWPLTTRALALLASRGIVIAVDEFLGRCDEYWRLSSTWNLSAKLMSKGDLEARFDDHIADSLSLVMSIESWFRVGGGTYVDIGSGGGFPAVPIKLVLPCLPTMLVERSDKKADFLAQALLQLELPCAKVIRGNFPTVSIPSGPRLYTARATERAAAVDAAILRVLELGDEYLAERELDEGLMVAGLTMERIADDFQRDGLRRGKLLRIWRSRPV